MTTGINKIRELTNKPITLGGYTYIQPKKLKPVKIPSISDILKQKAQDFKTGLGVVGEEISKLAKPLLTPVEKRPTKAMEFRVGEGLSEEKRISIQTPSGFASVSEKQNAVNKIKELAEGGKVFKKGNLFVDILQALPRAAKQIQLSAVKIENEQATMFPELASKLSGDRSITFQPKTPEERFLFGADEVKDVEGTGKNILKDFGASDETATKYGLLTGLTFAALDIIPPLPGKSLIKELGEEGAKRLIRMYGDDVAKQIFKKGGKELAEKALKGGVDDLLIKAGVSIRKDVLKSISGKSDEVLKFMSKVEQQNVYKQFLKKGNKDTFEGFVKQFSDDIFSVKTGDVVEVGGNKIISEPLRGIKPVLKPVTKGADLTQEASKFKSADEFIGSQTKVFHGTLKKEAEKITAEGIKPGTPSFITGSGEKFGNKFGFSTSRSKEVSKGFGDTVLEFHIDPGAKIAKGKDIPDSFFKKFPEGDVLFNQVDVMEWAQKQGFDAVDIGDVNKTRAKFETNINPFSEQEIQVLNPDILKTKAQLTDIFNKATETKAKVTQLKKPPVVEQIQKGQTTIVQSNSLQEGADVLGVKKKALLAQEDISKGIQKSEQLLKDKLPSPSVRGEDLPLAKLSDSDSSLLKPYNKTAQKSIVDTSKKLKEPVRVVDRVLKSVKKMKTDVVEYVQNTELRVKQLVEKKGVIISDTSDPYLRSTLYHGRVAEKVELGKEQVSNILKEMKDLSVKIKSNLADIRKEVNDYLLFRHAPERNLALGDGAAGITTKQAKEGLEAIKNSPRGKEIIKIAEQVQTLNNQTLDVLKDAGVITDDLYNTLRNKYKNHVPLNRIFEETEDIGSVLAGKGFDVKSTGIKRAVGSEKEVDDILTSISTNYEQAILRSEKNIVDQSTLDFVRANKDIIGDELKIIKPTALGKTFDGKFILEKTNDPTILQLFEKGKPIWIKIEDPALATALRGVGREKLGGILNVTGMFNRFYAGLHTRYNLEFALSNKIRDLQETAVYLSAQKDIGIKGTAKAVASDLSQKSTKAVLDSLRGIDSEGARLYKEMKSLGGTTGGFALSTKKNVEISIKKLEALYNSKSKRITNNLVEYVDNWNTIFEDSTRLTVYDRALKSGLSKDRAAFLAKEASINFNRMGKGGPVINALWMFSNASIQGTAKMISSLKNPKVLGATVAVVGASVAATTEWNDKADPDWRDKVSKWDRLNGLNVVLPTTNGDFKYITIPVSWGLKPIKVMADYGYDAMSGEKFDVKSFAEDTTTALIEAYNPAGGSDLVSAITPTILDLPVELARNKSWTGNKIKPDFDINAPEDIKYFDSLRDTKTGQVAISLSEALQKNTSISVSPADLKYSYEQYVGGAGRSVSKFLNAGIGLFSKEPVPLDEYPFLSRFLRERTKEEVGARTGGDTEEIKSILEKQSRERFELQNEAESTYDELSKLPKDEANEKAKQLKIDNPQLFDKLKDVVSDNKLGLSYTERLMKQLGVSNGERAKYIWQEVAKIEEKDEKNKYIKDLKDKGIISDTVMKQLKQLKGR